MLRRVSEHVRPARSLYRSDAPCGACARSGRLAMIAIAGMVTQELVSGNGLF